MLDYLKQVSYEALLHETFQIVLDDGRAMDLRLKHVYSLRSSSSKYDSFAVEFQGPHDFFLQQRRYPLAHDQMGTFTLFLVPVEEVADGYMYQAVFNVARDEAVNPLAGDRMQTHG
jgi:hypothetical protein